jgi:hypothetical protein
MENFLVSYETLTGENLTSEWFFDFNALQVFMASILGFSNSAKVMKFANGKMVGTSEVFADTENETWAKK